MADFRSFARVEFTFPFHLGIEAHSFAVQFQDEKCYVRVHCGYLTRRFELEQVADRNDKSRYTSYRMEARQDDQRAHSRTILLTKSADWKVVEVADTIGYSRVEAFFPCEGVPLDDKAGQAELRRTGMALVQHFIRHYRLVTMDHNFSMPTEDDSFADKLAISTEYEAGEDDIAGHYEARGDQLRWPTSQRAGLFKKVTTAGIQKLKESLSGGQPIYLHDELMSEAAELTLLHEDYKLAVILCEMSFETFVQYRIAAECVFRRITTLTDKNGTMRAVTDAISDGDLKRDLLGDYAFQLTGKHVKDGNEYQEWDKNAYGLRNEIVHRGRSNVTEQESKRASASVAAYTSAISTALIAGRTAPPAIRQQPALTLQRRLGRALKRLGAIIERN